MAGETAMYDDGTLLTIIFEVTGIFHKESSKQHIDDGKGVLAGRPMGSGEAIDYYYYGYTYTLTCPDKNIWRRYKAKVWRLCLWSSS